MLGARAVAVLDVDIADMAYAPARPRRDLRHVAGRTALDPAGLRRASRPLRRATRSNKSRCRATSTRPRRLPCPCRRRRPCCRSSPCSRCRASGSGRPLAARGRRCRAPACRARSAASRSAFSRQSSRASADAARPAPPGLPHRACRRPPASSPALLDLFPLLFRGRVRFRVLHCTSLSGRRAPASELPPPVRESLQRSLQIFHGLGRRARLRAHVPARHGTLHTEGAPTRNRRDVRPRVRRASAAARAARRGSRARHARAAVAAAAGRPAARRTRRRGGRCGRHAARGLDSELAPPLSLFFWQPAPAARPAIRRPAKTARDTCRSEYRCMTPPLMSMWMEHAGAQFACRAGPSQPPRFHSFFK